jgi:protein ImuB
VLFEVSANRQLVVRGCERAEKAGVRPGMTVAQARALIGDGELCVEPYDPVREMAALNALAVWAQRFSPLVAVDRPDGLLLDITGCERLFGGEAALRRQVVESISRLGIEVRVGVASTFGCAWAVARFGDACFAETGFGDEGVIVQGDERAALAALEIEALRLDRETVDSLGEVGIVRVGHLLALSRAELALRFGRDLLRRVDEALGSVEETITPVRASRPVAVRQVFDGPSTQLEAILLCVRELIGTLCDRLLRAESGAVRLELVVGRVDAAPVREIVALSRPSRDRAHLWTLLRPLVERINLGHGAETIELHALAAGLPHEQLGPDSDSATADQENVGRFVDTVVGRCGRAAVLQAELVASHLPERAFRMVPVEQLRSVRDVRRPLRSEAAERPRARRSRDAPDLHEPPAVPRPTDRPLQLMHEPQPIHVIALAPEGPPAWVSWRGVRTTVVSCVGPERIVSEWWRVEEPGDALGGTRDYYTIEDEQGRWLWIYRHRRSGAWYLHGQW